MDQGVSPAAAKFVPDVKVKWSSYLDLVNDEISCKVQ